MNVNLKYGRTTVSGTLPLSNVQTLIPRPYEVELGDLSSFLRQRLSNPTKGPGLDQIVKPGEKVVVVVSDITRTWTRTRDYLPTILEYLTDCSISPEDICILVARGCHRSQTEAEFKEIVGEDIFAKYEVVEHDADDPDGLSYVGTTTRKNPVYVNKRVVEADRVIMTGGIIHHAMAGFGGGRKSILPGISGRQTVENNHLHTLHPTEIAINPAIGSNKLQGNPLHEDMVEAAAFVNPDFLVNVVLDQHNEIVDFFTGHWLDAWAAGCELVNEIYGVRFDEQADLVVASCGGFPYDISLYQASKTFYNAGLATKTGGSLIVLVQAEDGPGSDDFFGWYENQTSEEFYTNLKANFSIPGYLAFLIFTIAQSRKVYVVTDCDAKQVAKMGVIPCESLQHAIDLACADLKDDAKVCIMPEGGFTFPIITS